MKKLTSLIAVAMVAMTMSAQSTRTIYLDASFWAGDNPVFAVHVWNTGDADAADYWFTKDNGNIYKADIRDDATKAIFLRKNPGDANVMTNVWAGEWNRSTTNIPTDKDKYVIKSWSSSDDDEHGEWMKASETPEPPKDVIVKVQKPAGWTELKIWGWGSMDATWNGQFTAWPGVAMTSIGNDWYQFTIKDDASFMFNNGQSGEAEQKTDQKNAVKAAACYTIDANKNTDGVYPLIDADCATATDVETVSQEPAAKGQKLMINGQLFILRDGKMYNAIGAEVK